VDLDFDDGRAWMVGPSEFQAAHRRAAERQSPAAGKLELHLQARRAAPRPPLPQSLPPAAPPRESLRSVVCVMLATVAISLAIVVASLISAQA
jgi:hypothetical protein